MEKRRRQRRNSFQKLSDLSKEQIESHEQNSSENINDLKIILANEVTAMLHGIEVQEKLSKQQNKYLKTKACLKICLPQFKQ